MKRAEEDASMADEGRSSRLGRGLAALIGDVGNEAPSVERPSRAQRKVPIEFVHANPRNPRRHFSDEELGELTDSVRERGIIQPIVVRARGADKYEIIAGERRWRAAQRAGLHEVPIVVVDVTDAEALELAIIENVQRADLNALEEAAGYQSLADEFKRSQDEIAKIVGKSRSHVANTMRLLKLSEAVKAHVRSGKLSAGHARMLVAQPNAEELAELIVSRGLNVRQVEELVREPKPQTAKAAKAAAPAKDADTAALETRLSNALGLAVTIDNKPNGSGTLQVRYRTLDQLDEVIRRLESSPKNAEADWQSGPRLRRV